MRKYWRLIAAVFAVVLGVLAVILWGSVLLQGPTAKEPPNAAEWLSAISTFWGAVASGLAAIGTAGALLIAAFSYKHQVDEKTRQAEERRQQADEIRRDAENQRRAQALQISVLTPASNVHSNSVVLQVHNGSTLPIKDVFLMCFNYSGQESGQWFQQVIAGGMTHDMFEQNRRVVDKVWASFEDASGQKWKVHINGELEEM